MGGVVRFLSKGIKITFRFSKKGEPNLNRFAFFGYLYCNLQTIKPKQFFLLPLLYASLQQEVPLHHLANRNKHLIPQKKEGMVLE